MMANPLACTRIAAAILLFAALALATGCGDGRPARIPVSGTVTYRGKPLDGANVTFVPKGSRPASGQTDAQGRFTLQTFSSGDGVVAGDHVVCVVKSVPDPKDKKKVALSKNDFRDTGTLCHACAIAFKSRSRRQRAERLPLRTRRLIGFDLRL